MFDLQIYLWNLWFIFSPCLASLWLHFICTGPSSTDVKKARQEEFVSMKLDNHGTLDIKFYLQCLLLNY